MTTNLKTHERLDNIAVDPTRSLEYGFQLYNEKSEQEDQEFLNGCNGAMDSLLVFVRYPMLPLSALSPSSGRIVFRSNRCAYC